jgi:hypothetical protein
LILSPEAVDYIVGGLFNSRNFFAPASFLSFSTVSTHSVEPRRLLWRPLLGSRLHSPKTNNLKAARCKYVAMAPSRLLDRRRLGKAVMGYRCSHFPFAGSQRVTAI